MKCTKCEREITQADLLFLCEHGVYKCDCGEEFEEGSGLRMSVLDMLKGFGKWFSNYS